MLKPIIAALKKSLGLAALLACLISSRAYGDVGVILNETLNESVARVTGSGHTAVYFSRICPRFSCQAPPLPPGRERRGDEQLH
jgi:hypothetical protein